ncbi:MAG: threonine--tRNA ligase [Candidatus Saccharimonadales bacterium]
MVDQPDQLQAMRHSLAHIMATAVRRLWPSAKFGVGPVVENGFYYDVDLGEVKISEEDFGKIEAEMRKVIEADEAFERFEKPIDEAIAWAQEAGQPYKEELLNDLKRAGTTVAKDLSADELGTIAAGDAAVAEVSFYKNGDFVDLCRGPHVESTGKIGAFKLLRVSGAYWRGNEKNAQMQRIYGVAFATEKELRQHLELLEQAKKRDHRKLGQELNIFMGSELVGAGLPLLLPRGETVKHTLMEYMRQKEEAAGYQYVSTPVLAHEELYKRSGHAQFYAEDMYQLVDDEGNKFYLKPMNCPHHHIIYEKLVQSYNDLPLRLAEASGLYRNELSGTLTGLIRVRGPITQNDAHIYVTPEQLKEEFLKVIALFDETYLEIGIHDYWFRLSLPDFSSDKFGGDKEQWQKAGEAIRQALIESSSKFVEAEGEAAFYGPKLDVQIRNVLGKEDSIATVQVDILVPERMNLTYVDNDGQDKVPIIIHRAIIGSFERFIAFLLEQTAGRLPVWLAPEQIRVITVNQEEATIVFADEVAAQAAELGLRLSVDNSNESVGKKIRAAELMKVPYTVVIGEKEIASREVVSRIRKDMAVRDEAQSVGVEEFLKTVAHEATSRVYKTSL